MPGSKTPHSKKVMVKVKFVKKRCLRISQMEKCPLESHERDSWTMMKMI